VKRISRGLLFVLLLLSAVVPGARGERPQEAPAPAATPATPAPAPTPTPPDSLDEFVPREKVKADSVVAFPVDI
jgi:hypothetical protein